MPLCRARSSNSRFSIVYSWLSQKLVSFKRDWQDGAGQQVTASQVGGEQQLSEVAECKAARHATGNDRTAELHF
jgi:hypothetical protein